MVEQLCVVDHYNPFHKEKGGINYDVDAKIELFWLVLRMVKDEEELSILPPPPGIMVEGDGGWLIFPLKDCSFAMYKGCSKRGEK
eukprot:3912634-Ditylum_brightwellii.AAC.1